MDGTTCGRHTVALLTAIRAGDRDAIDLVLDAADTRELCEFIARLYRNVWQHRLGTEEYERALRRVGLSFAVEDSEERQAARARADRKPIVPGRVGARRRRRAHREEHGR